MSSYDLSDLRDQSRWITDIQIDIATESIYFIEKLIDKAINEDVARHRGRLNVPDGPILLPGDADCITYEVAYQPFIAESLIISIHRILEVAVTQYCDYCQTWTGIDVSYKTYEGNRRAKGMEKRFNYMTGVLGLDLQKGTEPWERLMAWNRVRHVLVHNDGYCEKDEWYEQCRNIGVRFDSEDGRRIVIDFSDCKKYLETVSAFLSMIYSQIPKPIGTVQV